MEKVLIVFGFVYIAEVCMIISRINVGGYMYRLECKLQRIGTVLIDSGCLVMIDPCYLYDSDNKGKVKGLDDKLDTWHKVCDWIDNKHPKFNETKAYPININGGLLVHSAVGDGEYPVYANIVNNEMRQIVIDFWQELEYPNEELDDD